MKPKGKPLTVQARGSKQSDALTGFRQDEEYQVRLEKSSHDCVYLIRLEKKTICSFTGKQTRGHGTPFCPCDFMVTEVVAEWL